MRNYKEEFIELLKSTEREGVDYVIEDLTDLDIPDCLLHSPGRQKNG